MNKKHIKRFISLCKQTQKELKIYLTAYLKASGYNVIAEDGFVYAKGELPYLVTAHMDTVHKVTCKKADIKKINGYHVISSKDGIGGDDRCGIFMILELVDRGYRPSILFCEDEEIGGVGSQKFCKTKYVDDLKEMNYLIELDRVNADDAVFYDCGNMEFKTFILDNTGYKKAIGSFSDISELSPVCDVASVNFSCGYYNAHTTQEYVVMSEMLNTIDVVAKLFDVADCPKFDYQEEKYYGRYFGEIGYFGKYYNDYKSNQVLEGVEFTYVNDDGEEMYDCIWGTEYYECLGQFLEMHPTLCYNDITDFEEIYW